MVKKFSALFLCLCLLCTFTTVLTSATVIYDESTYNPQPTWPGATNLLPGGDFENGALIYYLTDWSATSSSKSYISFENDSSRGGKVLKMNNASNASTRVILYYDINNVIPNVTYQVTAKVKTTSLTGECPSTGINSPYFSAEYYKEDGSWNSMFEADPIGSTQGSWANVMQKFTPLAGTTRMRFCVVFDGTGTVYFDDIECKPIGDVVTARVNNQCFVYSEWDYTNVEVLTYDTNVASATLSISDGNTVLYTDTQSIVNKEAAFTYPVSVLKEPGQTKGYTLKVSYKNAGGSAVGNPYTEMVYRYDRPTMLTENGLVVHPTTGETITPVVGYSTFYEDLENCADMGITVGILDYASKVGAGINYSIDEILTYLDTAWYDYGVMTYVALFDGKEKSAGHPDIVDRVAQIVTRIKDHPGLFGYVVYDEPFTAGKLDATPYNTLVNHLKNAYKVIRDIDPVHPMMLCEASTTYAYDAARVVDILAVDPYPRSNPMALYCYNFIDECRQATQNLKPICNVMQAFEYGGWDPEPNDVRHMAYQGLFAQCEVLGYYTFSKAWYQNPVWDRLCGPGVEALADGEFDDAYKAFITGEYPTFNENSGDTSQPYWYKSYVKNDVLYMVIMNTTADAASVSIPLTSWDGKISIGEFTANCVDINGASSITGNGTLSFTLPGNGIYRYAITPTAATSYASLSAGPFRDLYTASVASVKPFIDKAGARGVIDGTSLRIYSPALNITRGDYVDFLFRALQFTGTAENSFSDVPTFAPFADAVTLGKDLGILKGNAFDPYNTLTWQALIDITMPAVALLNNPLATGDIGCTIQSAMGASETTASVVTRGNAAKVLARISDWTWDANDAIETSIFSSFANQDISVKESLAYAFASTDQIQYGDSLWSTTWSDGQNIYAVAGNNGTSSKTVTFDNIYASAQTLVGGQALDIATGSATVPANTVCLWKLAPNATNPVYRFHVANMPTIAPEQNAFVTYTQTTEGISCLSGVLMLTSAEKSGKYIDIPVSYMDGSRDITLYIWDANLAPATEKIVIKAALPYASVEKDDSFEGDDYLGGDIFGK